METVRFVGRRLAIAVPLLVISSFVIFALTQLAPGSVEKTLTGGKQVSPATLAAIRAEYHLDDPFLLRYVLWLGDAVHGNLGASIQYKDSVVNVIASRLPTSLELIGFSFVLILVFGLGLGVVSGLNRGRLVDRIASGASLVGSTISPYISGVVLIAVFAVSIPVFPVFGIGDGSIGDTILHLTLPAIAISISLVALLSRVTAAALGEVYEQDYVKAAQGRGFGSGRILLRHAARGASVPVVTLAGIILGTLVAGTVLAEYTFALDGVGALLVNSVLVKDFPVIQGVTLLIATTFILLNLIVDVVVSLIDPRVRTEPAA